MFVSISTCYCVTYTDTRGRWDKTVPRKKSKEVVSRAVLQKEEELLITSVYSSPQQVKTSMSLRVGIIKSSGMATQACCEQACCEQTKLLQSTLRTQKPEGSRGPHPSNHSPTDHIFAQESKKLEWFYDLQQIVAVFSIFYGAVLVKS